MSTDRYESLVTPSLIDSVFHGSYLQRAAGKWCITLNGQVVTIAGKICFDSKQQSTKAFYNSFHWRVMRHLAEPGSYWWNDTGGTDKWKTFKKVIKRDYGFKIIQL